MIWKNKKFNMVISLLIAIALWVFVIGTMDPVTTKTFQDIPVNFTHLEELSDHGLAIASTSVKEINVTAQGKKSVMNETDAADVVATIDAKDLKLGENKCRIATKVNGKASVKNQSTSIAYVRVEKITSVDKNIVVIFSNSNQTKLEPTALSQSEYQVEVKGATSIVSRVDHVNAVIPASEVSKSSSTLDAELIPVDKNGNKVSNVVLEHKKIEVEAVLYKTKTVDLNVQVRGQGDKKIEKPDSVVIKGPSDILDTLSEIRADDVSLYAVNQNTEIKLNLQLPAGVYVAASSKDVVLKVTIAGSISKTFEIDSSQIKVETENTYKLDSKDITVTLTGPKSIINNLSKSDIKLTVDPGEKLGQINCEIRCHKIEGVSDIDINPKKIQINIEE